MQHAILHATGYDGAAQLLSLTVYMYPEIQNMCSFCVVKGHDVVKTVSTVNMFEHILFLLLSVLLSPLLLLVSIIIVIFMITVIFLSFTILNIMIMFILCSLVVGVVTCKQIKSTVNVPEFHASVLPE